MSLEEFLEGQELTRVSSWGEDDNYIGERVETPAQRLIDADVVNSIRRDREGHNLILDLDYPAYVVPSTNGNSHLYLDLPQPLSTSALAEILEVLSRHGIIEEGYALASIERGHTALRRPGRRKGRPIPRCRICERRGDRIHEYQAYAAEELGVDVTEIDIQDIEDWIWANEGTITKAGLFYCTDCYIEAGQPLNPGAPSGQ